MNRKRSLLIIVVLLLNVLVVVPLFFSESSEAAIITVGPGKDYDTIEEAIDNAEDGDTIYIYAGDYYAANRYITISNLTIVGESVDTVFIHIGPATELYFLYDEDDGFISNITFKDITFIGTYGDVSSAFVCFRGSYITIDNCVFVGNLTIGLTNSEYSMIRNCTFSGGEPVYTEIPMPGYSGYSHIKLEVIDDGEPVLNGFNTVENCIFEDSNVAAISIFDSKNNTVKNNIFRSLSPVDDMGMMVFAVELADLEFEGMTDNRIYHNDFISIDRGNNARDQSMEGNIFDDEVGLGNYWSDYIDEDLDENGIWDNPYLIEGYSENGPVYVSQDNFPSVNPINDEVEGFIIKNIQASPSTQFVGGFVNISCVVDWETVDSVYVNISGPAGFSTVNISMTSGSDDVFYYRETYDIVGTYTYFIWANDTGVNTTKSTNRTFNIIPLDVPILYVDAGFDEGTPDYGVKNFSSIQDAVDAASPFYKIIVNGDGNTYDENVLVEISDLEIIGNYSTERPLVVGQGPHKSVFEIMGDNVTISGFTVDNTIGKANAFHGIAIGMRQGVLENYYDCMIVDCKIIESNYGIISRGGFNTFERCEIGPTVSTAIYCVGGNNYIYRNNITGCTKGIDLVVSSHGNIIFKNDFISNSGLAVDIASGNNNNLVFHNNFINNNAGGKQVRDSAANTNYWNNTYPLGGNYWNDHDTNDEYHGANQNILGGDGIADKDGTFDPYVFTGGSDWYPFISSLVHDVLHVDDDFTSDIFGYMVDFFPNITSALEAVDEGGMIYVYPGLYDETLNITKTVNITGISGEFYQNHGNIILNCSSDTNGITVNASYVNISGFTVLNAQVGIYMGENSHNCSIVGMNIVNSSHQCIFLYESSDNLIIKNNLSVFDPRDYYAVDFYDVNSRNNMFYHNNFILGYSRHISGSNTIWNASYHIGGNFWSGYDDRVDAFQGIDQNIPGSDGIADTPFLGMDQYPLMSPYEFKNQAPYVYNPSPTYVERHIDIDLSSLSITLEDPEGDLLDWTIECKYINNVHMTNDVGGVKIVPLSQTLPYYEQIYWYVNVTDGNQWTNRTFVFITKSYLNYLYPGSTPVQDAIDDTSAEGTVVIYRGLFEGNIIIDKPITIIGENVNTTIISGLGVGDVISIESDDVFIYNITVSYSGRNHGPDFDAGVDVRGRRNIELNTVKLINNLYGVYANDVVDLRVVNCTIHATKTENRTRSGVYVVSSADVLVENSVIGGIFIHLYGHLTMRYGIAFSSVVNSQIVNNNLNHFSTSMPYGNAIHMGNSSNIYVASNVISHTPFAIHTLFRSNNNIFVDNYIYAVSWGMYIDLGNGCIISRNTFLNAGNQAITLYGLASWMENDMLSCDGHRITGNTFAAGGIGIWLHDSSYNHIFGNNFSGNTVSGMDIYAGSSFNTITQNDFYGRDFGAGVDNVQKVGLKVRSGATGWGLECHNNMIYHNNFYDNVMQIMDEGNLSGVFSEYLYPVEDVETGWNSDEYGRMKLVRKHSRIEEGGGYVVTDGSYIYVAGNNSVSAFTFNGNRLSFRSNFVSEGIYPYHLFYQNGYIYSIWNNRFLKILTFNGVSFSEVYHYRLEYEVNDIHGDGNNIFIVDKDGLVAFTFDGNALYELDRISVGETGSSNSFFEMKEIYFDGTYIYVINYENINVKPWVTELYSWEAGYAGYNRWMQQEFWKKQDDRFEEKIAEFSAQGYHNFQKYIIRYWCGIRSRCWNFILCGSPPFVPGEHTRIDSTIEIYSFSSEQFGLILNKKLGRYTKANDIWVDGNNIFLAMDGSFRWYRIDGSSINWKLGYGSSGLNYNKIWSDSSDGSGNIYVTASRSGLPSRISVFSYDEDEPDPFIALSMDDRHFGSGREFITGDDDYIYTSDFISGLVGYTRRLEDGSHYSLVDERASNFDYDDSYITVDDTAVAGIRDVFSIDFLSIDEKFIYQGVVNVTIRACVKMPPGDGASGSIRLFIKNGTDEIFSDVITLTVSNEYVNYSAVFPISPSGTSWTYEDFKYLKIGVVLGAGSYVNSQPRVTSIYAYVLHIKEQYNRFYYDYPVGGNYFSNFCLPEHGAYDRFSGPLQDIPGSDGIVDGGSLNPFNIPGTAGSSDIYPLLNPYAPFLKADFTYRPSKPQVDETVYFTDRSVGPYIVSHKWNFGDGTSSSGKNPYHVYRKDGTYQVSLTVTDASGNTDTARKTIVVGEEGGLMKIPPLQPPKYPHNPFTIPEMYELLRADVSSNNEVVVVVIDSGNYNREYDGIDLGNVINMKHDSYTSPVDTFGHGTWVNYAVQYGIVNYNPNAVQYSIKAFDTSGSCSLTVFLECLEMAKELKPDIITISAGLIGTPFDMYSRKIDELRESGILVTVSAGNSGPAPSTITSPALARGATGVGATDPMQPGGVKSILDLSDDTVCEWSSRGPVAGVFPKPDMTAPGESIIGPWLSGHKIASGTSMAAPLVASVGLQTISYNKPLLDIVKLIYGNSFYIDIIETSIAESCYDKGERDSYGWGIPNARVSTEHARIKAIYYILLFIITVIMIVSMIIIFIYLISKKRSKKSKAVY